MSVPTSTNAPPVTEEPLPVQRDSNGSTAIHRSPRALLGVTPSAHLPSTPDKADNWAICCSGGGIRSATYCLGGLQTLDEGSLLGQAKWIIGISGGSYIAASRALVAYGLRQAEEERQAEKTRLAKDKLQAKDTRPAYGRGTPEEDNLRNNTHYIAPDAKTVFVAVLSMLLGAAAIAILALAPVFALSHVWGWVLHSQGVLTWSGSKATASISAWTWWLAPIIAAAVTLVLFGYWWFTLVSGSPDRGAQRARLVGWFATIAASLAVLMLAVPPIIEWLSRSTGALGTVVRYFGFGGSGHWSWATFSGLIAAVVALARSSQKQLAKVSGPTATTSPPTGFTGQLATLIRGKLAPWAATIMIVGAGAFITVLWISTAARVGFSADQLVQVLAAVVIVAATRAVVDINRTSLHYVYRWRLADAYAVTRGAAHEKNPDKRQRLFAKAAHTRLSDLRGQDQPKLVIATTANVNADRTVPPGRGGFCLAFDPDKVTLHGDPSSDEPNVEVNTTDYEHLLGHTSFTLFDVVAISGAAFSPLMGSATRHASRLMLTLANLRLGVWMPHPTVVRRARAYLEQKERGNQKLHQQQENSQQENSQKELLEDSGWTRNTWLLLLWYVLPNLSWGHDSTKQTPAQCAAQKKKRELAEQREAQLWAHVLKLRSNSGHDGSVGDRLKAAVCWRLMQPTLGLLWAEAAGHTSYRATWVNVTDGGHYDNLGLVEALRRGANNIVVLDASGDSPHTWFTLGGAMALAWADAEVDVALDPTQMIQGGGNAKAPTLSKTQVLRPWARGTFTRPDRQTADGGQGPDGHQVPESNQVPDGHPVLPDGHPIPDGHQAANGQVPADHHPLAGGNLWVCKLGWWDGAPWDIRAYAAGHSTYPCDPTMQQLYDGTEFDAYHELGTCAIVAAATDGQLPLLPPR